MADKKYAGESGLSAVFAAIKSAINEKVTKVSGKDVVDTEVEDLLCNKTSDNDYILKAKVQSGSKTYDWDIDEEGIIDDTFIRHEDFQPVITVSHALPVNVENVGIKIEPQQNLHGYDKPWPGGGNKNKIDFKAALDYWGADYTDNGDGSYTITRVGSGYSNPYQFATSPSVVSISAASIVSLTTGGNWRIEIFDENDGWKSISERTLSQEGVNANKIRLNYSDHGDGATISKVQIELGSSVTSYVPYANECPISGWTQVVVNVSGHNVWDEQWEVGGINTTTGQPETASERIRSKNYIPISGNTDYFAKVSVNNVALYIYYYDENYNHITSSSLSHTTFDYKYNQTTHSPANARYMKFCTNGAYGTTYHNDISINYPNSLTDYVPYTGNVNVVIQLGQTIYGGTLNATTGVLTIDSAIADMGDMSWTYSSANTRFQANMPSDYKVPASSSERITGLLCSCYEPNISPITGSHIDGTISGYEGSVTIYVNDYTITDAASFKTARTGQKILYRLATPQTIQLTPTQLQMLLGYNTIYADTGDVSLDYKSDRISDLQDEIIDLSSLAFMYRGNLGSANNANNVVRTGWYSVQGDAPQNMPSDISTWCVLIVFKISDTNIHQLVIKGTSGIRRRGYGGSPASWSSWSNL